MPQRPPPLSQPPLAGVVVALARAAVVRIAKIAVARIAKIAAAKTALVPARTAIVSSAFLLSVNVKLTK
jgi:hypothetical protein